jgi:methylated-DNA-[protein]-cysteine S-methyltransferase
MNIYFYEYPIGHIGIAEDNGAVCRVCFGRNNAPSGCVIKETPAVSEAASQLDEYFSGKLAAFDLPFSLSGTDFQRSVWDALIKIPIGETRSYKDIAESIGNPNACRAVGMANNRNPLAIFIPCHRVVGHNGGLVGYAGGLAVKQYLLELEKRYACGPSRTDDGSVAAR